MTSTGAARGRVALVTGASGGIGLATAEALARRGLRVRLVGRDSEKLARAARAIAALGGDVASFRADFSSLDDVRRLADDVLARGEPLHVVIHNAGVWHPELRRSKDGFEDTIAVNLLAPFLLTHRLLPRLRETDGDRRHRARELTSARAGRGDGLRGWTRCPRAERPRGPGGEPRCALRLRRARGARGRAGARGVCAQQARSDPFLERARATGAGHHVERPPSRVGRDGGHAGQPGLARAPASSDVVPEDPGAGRRDERAPGDEPRAPRGDRALLRALP